MISTATARTETDSFGPIDVPGDAYWGAQTQRSIQNFPFGPRETMPVEIVHALGFVKQAAARVNARIGGLDAELAEAVQQAAAGRSRRIGRSVAGAGSSRTFDPTISIAPHALVLQDCFLDVRVIPPAQSRNDG